MANASVKNFKRIMARMPPDVRKASFDALNKYAERMQSAMLRFAPVESGKLRRSIRKEMDEANLKITLLAGGPETTVKVRRGFLGLGKGDYDYAIAQEFGTKEHAASPFFWPGYRLFKKPQRSAVKRAMTKAMKKHIAVREGRGGGLVL